MSRKYFRPRGIAVRATATLIYGTRRRNKIKLIICSVIRESARRSSWTRHAPRTTHSDEFDRCCGPRNNRKELITSVAAGKSYSLATNVQGQLLAWGKGWEGQLGHGKVKDFRVSP